MGPCHGHHRQTLENGLCALMSAVRELGLDATISGPLTLSVHGETPRPDEPDPNRPCPEGAGDPPATARYRSARPLSQAVTIKYHDARLWWCWVWHGPERGDYESEPIAPLEEVGEVARRLCYVVSLSATG